MKIKFFSKKETVLALIQLSIDSTSEALAAAEKKLEAVGKFALEGSSYHMDVERLKKSLERYIDLRSLIDIESHAGQFISVEEDLSI